MFVCFEAFIPFTCERAWRALSEMKSLRKCFSRSSRASSGVCIQTRRTMISIFLRIAYLNHLIPIFTQIINRHEKHRVVGVRVWGRNFSSFSEERNCREWKSHDRKLEFVKSMNHIHNLMLRHSFARKFFSSSLLSVIIIVNDVVPSLVISSLSSRRVASIRIFYFMLIKHEMCESRAA